MKYKKISNIKGHKDLQYEITKDLWPKFMFHDPISNKYWNELFSLYPDYQYSLKSNGEIIGIGNCLPLFWNKEFKKLPERGWDWALEKGIEDKKKNITPNTLCGLQIAVAKDHQNKGVSRLLLKEMVDTAEEFNLNNIIIPIRPSLKSNYPLTDMDEYITWKREDGLPYDPWLRVHLIFGGEIIKVCHKAMKIEGTINEWEKWTNLKFFESGRYIVKGALNPIKINIENDVGEYIEPNVWILHKV
ncbi:MAG: GNAT family N-acetyltransferase [Bacillota bacterium]